MDKQYLYKILVLRATKCIRLAKSALSKGDYYVAGSCIGSDSIRDIDVYPVKDKEFNLPNLPKIVSTKNATTYESDPPIQFCNYEHGSLKDLIRSFDFAHIQAGVHILDGEVVEVFYTEEYVIAKATSSSKFMGTKYPLSSLIRLLKYYERREISERSSIGAVIEIVCAIVERGFKDYDDFKDQLDAVDLGILPENYPDDQGSIIRLFELLQKVSIPPPEQTSDPLP